VLGALGLASREPGRYGPAELELLEPIAGQLAVALRNADLYAEVAASQRRLEAIVGGIGDGVFVTDPDGRISLWNAAAERLLGYSAAEVLGRRWQEVVHGRGADGLSLEDSSRGLIATLRERGVAHAEAQFLTRQGGELWVSVAIATLTVDDARHWVLVFRDISAYKEVERLKSDFVATVSHELRTPLASIKGYAATLLQRRDRLPPEIRDEYLAIINAEANRLNALVSDLLAVARLERGEVRLERVPTALAPIAHRVAERVARTERDAETLDGTTRYAGPSAAGDGAAHSASDAPSHRVEVAVPADLLALAAPDRLEQVVGNLVENAVKYSPRGGTIRIEGGTRDLATVYLAVADDGVGIPADRQDEVFQPFARVENVLTRETEGAGLGLYICQQLVERMGGTITLASEPGRGTTVTVSLEAAAASDTFTGLRSHASGPSS
jgi:PAS domain S-box-containing protein